MPQAPKGDFVFSDEFMLTLADGTRVALRAGSAEAARVVSFFARSAGLAAAPTPLPPETRRILAVTGIGQDALPSEGGLRHHVADVICVLEPPPIWRRRPQREAAHIADPSLERSRRACLERILEGSDRSDGLLFVPESRTEVRRFWRQLMILGMCIGRETHPRGGVLLHSGLALLPPSLTSLPGGEGSILLAGRSGVGKSTACARLCPPWRSLADDVTLVVRDDDGVYWAHPWPTWSRFFGDEVGDGSDTWDVQQATPLQALFVMEQGAEDRAEPMGPGHTIALLNELARQTSRQLLRGRPPVEIATFNLQRFDNVCALARVVPGYLLDVSRYGAFWESIAHVIQ